MRPERGSGTSDSVGEDLMPPFLAPDGFPLWDTFEAFIFFAAGLTTGVVLGFLFPSLWRGFRRRLRPMSRFVATESELDEAPLVPPFLVEAPPLMAHTQQPGALGPIPPTERAGLELRLTAARALFQAGRSRDSLNAYLALLRSPQISSTETARLMNELAQVYAELGLYDRALACAKEYHLMRRGSVGAFRQRFELAGRARHDRELLQAVKDFSGRLSSPESLRLAHRLLERSESLLELTREKGNVPAPFDALLDGARRLAPASQRLRHTQALRSFSDAMLASSQAADRLWVVLFAEISKRINLHLEQNLPLSLAVEPLVEAAALLSVSPQATEGHALAAPQIAALIGVFSPPMLEDWQNLGDLCLSRFSRQPTFKKDERLHAILRQAFPQSWAKWQEGLWKNRTPGTDDFCCTEALQIAMSSHSCATCKAVQMGHLWSCPSCGGLETLTPAFRIT